MNGPILVINAGASSIKFSCYEAAEKADPVALFKGQIEGIGLAPHMSSKDATGANIAEKGWPADGRWDWLGITLDREANARGAERISAADSRVSVWAIPTDEERMIVRQTVDVLGKRNVQRVEKPS
jgi:acetate kinase